MYLKKIIISNFKTFNGSKELIFSKGYTILSGPNGSGKSNTLDAILFVLGRHDDRLKKTVAEVISKDFNTNKLLADYAEVTLIFSANDNLNNENGEETIISRQLRIPASGKAYSIYKINGKDTTLNDILKVLPVMDYNIVKQGEITSRMYETPENRRKLIEEIAGLAQLDPLISESTAKIMSAKETLKRVGLLLKDAQKRLTDLEKEKERTLKYRELEVELRKYKAIKLYSTKLELNIKLAELEVQIKQKNEDISRIQIQISTLHQEIDQIFNQIKKLDQQKREYEKQKTEISVHYEMDLKNIEEFDQRLEEIKDLIQSLETRIDALKQEIQKLKQDKQKIFTNIKKSTEKQSQVLNEIKELQFQNTNLELDLPRLREMVNELDLRRSSFLAQIHEKDKNVRKIDPEIIELRQKRINLEERVEENEEVKRDQTSNLGKATRELRNLENERNLNNQKIEKIKQEIILNRQFLEKQQLEHQEFNSKQIELQKIITQYQQLLQDARPNYSFAVQKVLEARNRSEISGVIGTIIELIEDVKSDYAIAIEAAGGIKLQNVVTENFEKTKNIIAFIKKIKVGKITFYPLDIIEDWQLRSTPNDPKVIGKIIDLIKFDHSKYLTLMANIFKNTLVVKDLDTAKKYRSYRAVTLDGDLIEPGGWVTTRGSFEPRFLLIKEFYRKKITELKAEYDSNQQILKKLKEEQTKLDKQNLMKQTQLEDLVNSNNILKGRLLELVNKIKELEIDVIKWQNDLDRIKKDLMETKAEEQNAHVKLSKILEEAEALNKQLQEVEEEIANTELGKTEKLIEKNRIEILKFRETNRKFEKERELFNTQINQIESNIELKTERVKDIDIRINTELLVEREKLTANKKEKLSRIEAEHNQINSILENITSTEIYQKELQDKQTQLRQNISQNEMEIENFRNYIREELQTRKIRFELRIQELEKQIQDLGFILTEEVAINLEHINREINRLEIEISSLGLLDHQAPEKFEAESLRLSDLLKKQDLYEKEIEEALETKKDLLTQKKLKFLQTISDINTYLGEIFVKLYGKGNASLVLLDKNNPLESGIDIKIDVGSGNVDYIGTLSGGEKSMLALAFIFAIQRYKSAPIYFFDEIDSYLDPNRTEALGKLLKEFSRNSQYIVITPRLSALSTYADRIYGVWLENGTTEIVCQQAEDFAVTEEI